METVFFLLLGIGASLSSLSFKEKSTITKGLSLTGLVMEIIFIFLLKTSQAQLSLFEVCVVATAMLLAIGAFASSFREYKLGSAE